MVEREETLELYNKSYKIVCLNKRRIEKMDVILKIELITPDGDVEIGSCLLKNGDFWHLYGR